jgi:MFS family permease
MLLALKVVLVVLVCVLLFLVLRTIKRNYQLIVSLIFFSGGILMAIMIGTTTVLVMPGIGGIGMGGASGALVGYLTYLLIGTVGVVTGGLGLALGALGMSLIGFLLGAIGATFGGFGLMTIHSWVIAIPVILLGVAMFYRNLTSKPLTDQPLIEGNPQSK